ncbi:TIGR01777 family protein [Photobacterium aquimaris]|uniref:TIGR01777 family protein n=1 Tax=Photobacterium aquimaris TaxID=512643 RepID=A0A2T3IH38_9GAMM|nr:MULTISPECIES: TIGR01777 family oxidoreductase [Photobacterium]OBU11991.1 TIGR01777 family protein [Photobacterium aquimaris]OBU23568.1 TIGR01777 family protein [Photobacterium aquimaris]PSU26606.1 TIGR01777 family protein [Photobacterium aquimaris]PSW02028.1 TIGR01777 family protein [Photobacterium aquimaris]
MKILVTGATGLIGKALLPHLNHDEITIISRDPTRAYQLLGHHINALDSLQSLPNLNQFDVVINLAGEPIMDKRWSEQQKRIIEDSRWNITQQLVDKIQASDNPPHTFISGSAVGIYGDQHDRTIDETFNIEPDNTDFSQQVCYRWEQIALAAQSDNTRVCLLRTGIVLAKQGGALAKMLLPYQFGLGGPIGNGKQYFPWIQLQDMVRGILFLINHNETQGPYNFTAPNPVTNRVFSATLAATLHRPHLLFTPAWVLKLALGESSQLLLDGQRALPNKLQAAGFNFTFPCIEQALKQTLGE